MLNLFSKVASIFDLEYFSKVISIFAPGLLMSINVLMFLALRPTITFLPWEELPAIESSYAQRAEQFCSWIGNLDRDISDPLLQIRAEVLPAVNGIQNLVGEDCIDNFGVDSILDHKITSILNCNIDEEGKETCESLPRSESDLLLDNASALVGIHKGRIDAGIEATNSGTDGENSELAVTRLRALYDSPVILQSAQSYLLGTEQILDNFGSEFARLRNRYIESQSILGNLVSLESHIMKLVLMAIIFGIILGQLGRLFFHGISGPKGEEKLPVLTGTNRKHMIVEYYRYAEAAVNFIIPILIFGPLVCYYLGFSICTLLYTTLFTIALAFALYVSGRKTYEKFQHKSFLLYSVGDQIIATKKKVTE